MSAVTLALLPTGEHLLTFDRPNSSANIFDIPTLLELRETLDTLPSSSTGLIFLSAKPSIFIAGADLNALESLSGEDLRNFIELGQSVFNRIASLPIPTVAAIHGACVGGGYELCLACNWRIATPDRATKIGLPETQLGILPAWGGSTRLPRLIGVPAALDIILNGKTLPAKPARRRGLIDDIVPRELLVPTALKWIQSRQPRQPRSQILDRISAAIAAPVARRRMEAKSRGHYPALPKALRAVTQGAFGPVPVSLHRELTYVLDLATTPECRNLIRVHYLTERAKKLRATTLATLPNGIPTPPSQPANIQQTAVIGAGVMGASIAQWLSSRGLRVLLRDIDPDRVSAGVSRISSLYSSAVKRHILTSTEARDGLDRISPSASQTPLAGIDLIIEAAVEKMPLKKQIFTTLDATTSPGTILATNTSALSITDLASTLAHPGRVLGIHFFNPVHRMPLVEVVTGEKTSPETAQTALRFVQKIGKLPVLVRDSPGFLVNRILLPYMVEAGDLFAQGSPAAEVDAAMLDFGMPMGPLRLIDEVGLDVAEDVAATLAAAFPGHMHLPAVLTRMLAAHLLGKKSGAGFYLHSRDKALPNPAATQYRDAVIPPPLTRMAMQRRMVLLMVNEAARCIAEKVVAAPADVDFGMIMGAGFAPFRGGPLRYADSVGIPFITEALREEATRSGSHFVPCQLLEEMTQSNRKFYADP